MRTKTKKNYKCSEHSKDNDGGEFVKQVLNDDGYLTVRLKDNKGIYSTELVHVLVAATFIGPCPSGHKLIHIDNNKQNNNVKNLKYVKI